MIGTSLSVEMRTAFSNVVVWDEFPALARRVNQDCEAISFFPDLGHKAGQRNGSLTEPMDWLAIEP